MPFANAANRDDLVVPLFEEFCVRVSTTTALDALSTVRSDLTAFKAVKIDASQYSSPTSFARDLQVITFVKKYPGLPGSSSSQRREKAISTWESAEKQCLRTNLRLCHDAMMGYSYPPLAKSREGSPIYLQEVISTTQAKIASCLGKFNLSAVRVDCKWSSGATATKRRGTPLHKKISDKISVTPLAWPHLRDEMSSDLVWLEAYLGFPLDGPCSLLSSEVEFIEYNRFITVPKTAYTDRCIAAEPTGNSFLQQGVARYIRRALKRKGVDLDFGHERNKRLAQLAFSSSLSTIDLESASDTVAYALVKLLLPSEWFAYLNDLRAPQTRRPGTNQVFHLEKFSSMGNAFTFELETLIFWALSSSMNELMGFGDLRAVFGDDIVTHRETASSTMALLGYCGFSINKEKSFVSGPFFESCGGQYFNGIDVTPFHVDHPINTEWDAAKVHNKIYRWQQRIFGRSVPWLSDIMDWLRADSKLKIPDCVSTDDGFIRNPFPGYFSRNHGYLCRVRTTKKSFEDCDSDANIAVYAYKLRRAAKHQNNRVNGHLGTEARQREVVTVRWLQPDS